MCYHCYCALKYCDAPNRKFQYVTFSNMYDVIDAAEANSLKVKLFQRLLF